MFNLGKSNNQEPQNKQFEPKQTANQMTETQQQPKTQSSTYGTPRAKNVIGEGTKIEGNITSKGDIQIDGMLIGTIKSEGTLTVSNSGAIEGDVFCKDAEFNGEISGNVKARGKVTVRPNAHIKGDVRYYDLQVEPGAHIACTISRLNPESEKKEPLSNKFSSNSTTPKPTAKKELSKNGTEKAAAE